MPVMDTSGETERLARSTNAYLLGALAAVALLLIAAGMLAGRLSATMPDDASDDAAGDDAAGDDADAEAAETMDAYAPYAETWDEKHEHIVDEASGDDPNGLASAAEDARVWIDANRADLGALATSADGGSGPLYEGLVEIFDQRAAVLAAIETTASSGDDGDGAAADDVAALETLDERADATTCEIADVMRAEGDDPEDHVTAAMDIAC